MRAGIPSLILIIVLTLMFYQCQGQKNNIFVENGVALAGYDLVTYYQPSGPQTGRDDIRTVYQGAVFLFLSEENRQAFEADPIRYLPKYGGWCAYAIAENGDRVVSNPETYILENGDLYLFFNDKYRGKQVNTKLYWEESPQKMKEMAEKNWAVMKK